MRARTSFARTLTALAASVLTGCAAAPSPSVKYVSRPLPAKVESLVELISGYVDKNPMAGEVEWEAAIALAPDVTEEQGSRGKVRYVVRYSDSTILRAAVAMVTFARNDRVYSFLWLWKNGRWSYFYDPVNGINVDLSGTWLGAWSGTNPK